MCKVQSYGTILCLFRKALQDCVYNLSTDKVVAQHMRENIHEMVKVLKFNNIF